MKNFDSAMDIFSPQKDIAVLQGLEQLRNAANVNTGMEQQMPLELERLRTMIEGQGIHNQGADISNQISQKELGTYDDRHQMNMQGQEVQNQLNQANLEQVGIDRQHTTEDREISALDRVRAIQQEEMNEDLMKAVLQSQIMEAVNRARSMNFDPVSGGTYTDNVSQDLLQRAGLPQMEAPKVPMSPEIQALMDSLPPGALEAFQQRQGLQQPQPQVQ